MRKMENPKANEELRKGIEEYCRLTTQPWGKMFYEMIWEQMDIADDKTCNILDYGSGFGILIKTGPS